MIFSHVIGRNEQASIISILVLMNPGEQNPVISILPGSAIDIEELKK